MPVKRNQATFIRLLSILSIASVGGESLVAEGRELTSQRAQQSQAAKPNVVILIADQWRASAFGFSGDPNVKTPHLDRLARASYQCGGRPAGLLPDSGVAADGSATPHHGRVYERCVAGIRRGHAC